MLHRALEMQGVHDRRGARCFTLLEMMVVIVLIVLVMGLVLPQTLSTLSRSEFTEAQNQVEALLMLARADCQRQGVPIQVVARASRGGAGAMELRAAPMSIPSEVGEEAPARSPGGRDGGASGTGRGHVGGVGRVVTLPPGVRITATPPRGKGDLGSVVGGAGEPADPASAAGPSQDGQADADVVVAVFFPDGRVVPAGPRYLVRLGAASGDPGQAVRLEINGWTGAVTASRVAVDGVTAEGSRDDAGPPARREDSSGPGGSEGGGR